MPVGYGPFKGLEGERERKKKKERKSIKHIDNKREKKVSIKKKEKSENKLTGKTFSNSQEGIKA